MSDPIMYFLCLVACCLNLLVLVSAWKVFEWRDIYFSPQRLYILAALLDAASNFYLILNLSALYEHVFSMIPAELHSMTLVFQVLMLRIFINLVCLMSIYFGVKFAKTFKYGGLLGSSCSLSERMFSAGPFFFLVYFSIACWSTFVFSQNIGGLIGLWLNMGSRLELVGGNGYIQLVQFLFASSAALTALLIFYKRFKIASVGAIIFCCILLSLGGQRSPAIYLVLSCFVFYSIKISAIRSIISPRNILLGIFFVQIILVMLVVREDGFKARDSFKEVFVSSVEKFEGGFVARLGRLERDLTAIEYFADHDFWLGSSYAGLLVAPLPRSWVDNKPPLDSGMYLRSIGAGRTISPPMPLTQLDGSSWPEGHYSGYMNFGYIGLAISAVVSSTLFGFMWGSLRKYRYPTVATMIICIYFITPFTLSPKDLVFLGSTLLATLLFIVVNILLSAPRRLLGLPSAPSRSRVISKVKRGL